MASKKVKQKSEQSDEGEGGSGQAGGIAFRDFVTGTSQQRDDQLLPDELRRLRAVHNTAHELRVKKQKEVRVERENVKNGKVTLADYRQSKAAELSSKYPPHPLLANKAQFSGVDKQENQVPSLSETQTNDENRNELENRYEKKYQPEMGKKFHPKPQYR